MRKLRILLAAVLGCSGSYGFAESSSDGSVIEAWTRKPGDHANISNQERLDEEKIVLNALSSQEQSLFDAQYNKKGNYKTVSLEKVVNAYTKCKGCDLILLQFSNGMQIPLPRDSQMWGKLNPQIATAIKLPGKKSFKSEFPQIAKKDQRYRDPRPIQFQGNKVVVHDLWHPLIPDPKKAGFSPWQHGTTLVGIEFADKDAYYAQFRVSKSEEVNVGMELFQNRCQYCHGIQLVGARLGWDYLEPIPIFKLKDINHVYQLVKYRYHDELERGLLMPEQADVTSEQTGLLWAWLKALAPEGVKKYQPK
jgi:hypothetical protein